MQRRAPAAAPPRDPRPDQLRPLVEQQRQLAQRAGTDGAREPDRERIGRARGSSQFETATLITCGVLLDAVAGGKIEAMASDLSDLVIRVADGADVAALAELRALWSADTEPDRDFSERLASWMAAEGERRTTWLAALVDRPVGMASLFEYRRMPKPGREDSRWGYVGNMFVREDSRNRGIGAALLSRGHRCG